MKVLVATDGSKESRKAIKKLESLFDEAEDTEVRVISVAEPPVYGIELSSVLFQMPSFGTPRVQSSLFVRTRRTVMEASHKEAYA
jgi:nucleotide-binding universal stress UspA family protein